jgi:uncharacterized DUF497 family protein
MFEFDPAKSAANKAKHGIDFEEAKALWQDEDRITFRAKMGADGEERWLVIGRTEGKHWSAVVTFRSDVVRLISVRRSREDEVKLYEQKNV